MQPILPIVSICTPRERGGDPRVLNEKNSAPYTNKNIPVVVVNDDIVKYSPTDKELLKM